MGADRDLFLPGDCDATVEKLVAACGWTDELQQLIARAEIERR